MVVFLAWMNSELAAHFTFTTALDLAKGKIISTDSKYAYSIPPSNGPVGHERRFLNAKNTPVKDALLHS